MASGSFRALELEQLRMELRRELRIEASNFFEDDGSDDDFDAVIGHDESGVNAGEFRGRRHFGMQRYLTC